MIKTTSRSVARSRALSATIFLALTPHFSAGQIRTPSRDAVSHMEVRGLAESTGAMVMLINAQRAAGQAADDNNCLKSVIVPLDGAQVSTGTRWSAPSTVKAFHLDIAPHVDEGCWCKDEKAGLAVLAPGKAISYIANTKRGALPRLCTQPPGGLMVDMRPRREVMIKVWVAEGNNSPSMAKDDIANADWIYDKALAGITLRPLFHEVKPEIMKQYLPECFPNPNEKACCAKVGDSDFFEPGAINVYYGMGSGNYTCDSGVPAASFIHDVPVLGDAAHEIGHALGLFQRDSDSANGHPTGHTTTDKKKFGCENVMWEGTHFLKEEITPGQAFWMSLSGVSFVGKAGANLTCADKPGASSPCPLFALGHEEPYTSRCSAIELERDKLVILRHRDQHDSCDLPSSTYKNGRQLADALRTRYDLLKRHVRGGEDLQLGATALGGFLDHWSNNLALNITPLGAMEPGRRSTSEMQKERSKALEGVFPSRTSSVKFHLEEELAKARSNVCKPDAAKPSP